MAVDTLIAYAGVYDNVADAEADYQLVHDLHTEAGLIDAYDAAVIERRDDGKTKIVKKHETPTRVGGVLGGGIGLATGLVVALFPFAAVGGGLLAATVFETRRAEKTYLALVRGDVTGPRRIDFPLAGTRRGGMRVATQADKAGLTALTVVTPRERFGNYTLCTCIPKTGRTHQVRIHLGDCVRVAFPQ